MKYKPILLLALAVTMPTASFADIPMVTVTTADKSVNIALADVHDISFTEEEMVITKNSGWNAVFPNADGWSIELGEGEVGISDITMDPLASHVLVYDTNGILVHSFAPGETIDFDRLSVGVYIVSCGSRRFKITRQK